MAYADNEYRCFVGGLAWATDEQSIERCFNEFGEVFDSKIIIDRETGRSKGFRFVTFKDEDSMRTAIDRMNGQELDGRNITAQARGSGTRGGMVGGYGSGGYRGRRDQGGYNRGGGGGYGGGYGGDRREGGYGDGGYGGQGRSEGGSWRN
uniref:Probable glycine-rich RNA-binding protein 1 n=1 Tax=Arabidopsis thaliana TaxID=3702 RepID=RBG1_ARATH|nr:RecName: Full=Probable glycine-rich RNA-binding protein 1; Short=AtGR-RBP1; AltName: Full=AtRBG1 [Arabidopsis thaliana]